MNYIKTLCSVAASFSLLLGASQVNAALIVYEGVDAAPGNTLGVNSTAARADFLSNLSGGVGTEDFESFASFTSAPLNLTFPGSTGSLTASLTGAGQVRSGTNTGRFATSGSNYIRVVSGNNFQISFGTAISAFGFNGTDIGDFSGQFTLVLTDLLGATSNFDIDGSATSGSSLFWGFIDTTNSYTNIAFTSTAGDDILGLDDMTIGDAAQVVTNVPAPSTLALMGLALVALSRRAFVRAK